MSYIHHHVGLWLLFPRNHLAPLTNLLHPIHNPIQQTDQLITHKPRTVNLNKVPAVHGCDRSNRPPWICDMSEAFVVSAPRRIRVCHRQEFGDAE